MDIYTQAVNRIIHEQESIIGPLALDQARKITGIKISGSGDVEILGNPKEILGNLVVVYSEFFGHASVEVCKEAIQPLKSSFSSEQLPDILK